MKKTVIAIICIMALLFTNVSGVFAAANPISMVLLDGKAVKLKGAPSIIGKEVYFPLNSALTIMGITSKSAKVDTKKKEVTLTKGKTKIYAKFNSKSVKINNKTVRISAPVTTKGSTVLIPACLIKSALNKVTFYSDKLKAVSVVNQKDFDQLKDIFTKTEAASSSLTDFKFDMAMDMDMGEELGVQYTMDIKGAIDVKNKNAFMNMGISMPIFGTNDKVETEMFMLNGISYMKDPLTGDWDASEEGEISGLIDLPTSISSGEEADEAYNNLLISSFRIVTGKKVDTIYLKNDVFASIISGDAAGSLLGEDMPAGFNMSITMMLDKNTKMLTGYDMSMSGKEDGQEVNVDMKFNIYDCNEGVILDIPEDLQEFIDTGADSQVDDETDDLGSDIADLEEDDGEELEEDIPDDTEILE